MRRRAGLAIVLLWVIVLGSIPTAGLLADESAPAAGSVDSVLGSSANLGSKMQPQPAPWTTRSTTNPPLNEPLSELSTPTGAMPFADTSGVGEEAIRKVNPRGVRIVGGPPFHVSSLAAPTGQAATDGSSLSWFESTKPTISKYVDNTETAKVYEPILYQGSRYVIVVVHDEVPSHLDPGDIEYSPTYGTDFSEIFYPSSWVGEVFVIGLDGGPHLIPKSDRATIEALLAAKSAPEYQSYGILDQPGEWYVDYQQRTLDAELVNWQQEISASLKTPRDRYLAALQAMTVTRSENIFIKDTWEDELKSATSATDSAAKALEIAGELEERDTVQIAGRAVDAELTRRVLIDYAAYIEAVKTAKDYQGSIEFAGSLADLVLSVTEVKVYKEERVEALARVQDFASTHESVSLAPGLDAAITEIREQHREGDLQLTENIVMWIKENGIDVASQTGPKLASKFASWLVSHSAMAASVSSWVTSTTAATLIAGAASVAGAAVFGLSVGGMLVGQSGMYAHMVRAKYSRLARNEFADIEGVLRAEYGDQFEGAADYTQAEVARVHLDATYLKFLALGEFYHQEYATMKKFGPLGLDDWWYDILNGAEAIAYDLFGRSYVDEQENAAELRDMKLEKARDIASVGLEPVLDRYPEPITDPPSQRPVEPSPSDGAGPISPDTVLNWGTAGSMGESVEFKVHLERGDSTPETVIGTTSSTKFTPDLQAGTQYYWKVVAIDANGIEYVSDVWSFSTQATASTNLPTISGPSNGVTTVPYTFNARTADANNDQIYYRFDWGDGSTTRFPTSGTTRTGVGADVNHIWTEPGTYTVRVKTVTESGLESPWSKRQFTVEAASVSDTVYAGKYLSGQSSTSGNPPYATYSIAEYQLETVAYSDEWTRVNIYKNGDKRVDNTRLDIGKRPEFFDGDLVVLLTGASVLENQDSAIEFYYAMTKTDPSIVTVQPASPTSTQGSTAEINLQYPGIANPDEGVCGPEAYLFGKMKGWVGDDSDWVDGIDSDFGGQARRVDADCDNVADGEFTLDISVPDGASPGTHSLDIIFDTGKGSVYRMKNIEVDVTEANDPPTSPSNPTPGAGNTGVATDTRLQWQSTDPNGDDIDYEIYIGKGDVTPEPVGIGVEEAQYQLSGLDPGTTYYWQVVAADSEGTTAASPVWQFTTRNAEPTASFDYSPSTPVSGADVVLDATASTDPDGPIDVFRWDLDGDGSFDDAVGQVVESSFRAGSHDVSLRVVDRQGATDISTQTIDVRATTPSVEDFGSSNPSERELQIQFNSSERLTEIEVRISQDSKPVHTLTKQNFTGTGSGPYTYQATYIPDEPGAYSVSLVTAMNAEGNEAESVASTVFIGPTAVGSFDSRPTDPDGDNTFEDVNGNGEFNIVDVQALYAHREDSVISANAGSFDFNGNGEFNIVDVQRLYVEQTSE